MSIQDKERDNLMAFNNHEKLMLERKKVQIKAQLGIQKTASASRGPSRLSFAGGDTKKDDTGGPVAAASAATSTSSLIVENDQTGKADGVTSDGSVARTKSGNLKSTKKQSRNARSKSSSSDPSIFPRKGDKYVLAKCPKIVRSIIDLFSMGKFIRCKHLSYILFLFTAGGYPRTDFGSYRVDLVVALISRIQDIQNIELVLTFLTKSEQACVIARLGWLVLLNTLRVDNSYDLNLSRWEERQITKILVQFAHTEPGTNFLDPSFCLDRSSPPVPGWELPVSWYVEETFPNRGILSCRYYAGDGFCLKGCRPKRLTRYALLPLCLVRLSDLVIEEKEFVMSQFAPASASTNKDVSRQLSSSNATISSSIPVPNFVSSIPNVAQSLTKIHSILVSLDPPITWTYDSVSDCHAEVIVEGSQ
jgi:hypothetical protein